PLQLLYGSGKREFLPYPPAFALEHVLHIPPVALNAEPKDGEWLRHIVEAVLLAPSKQVLKYPGIKYPENPRLLQYFDLDGFDADEDEPQRKHAALLEGIRSDSIDSADRTKWAAWI